VAYVLQLLWYLVVPEMFHVRGRLLGACLKIDLALLFSVFMMFGNAYGTMRLRRSPALQTYCTFLSKAVDGWWLSAGFPYIHY
jgi:hypothetical protein